MCKSCLELKKEMERLKNEKEMLVLYLEDLVKRYDNLTEN